MPDWKIIEPKYGDLIRVKRPNYYHVGIFYKDNKVIHFASDHGDSVTAPQEVYVHIAPMNEFLLGGALEVAQFNKEEKKNIRLPDKIIEIALSHINDKGYDFMQNNCEHFANRCVYIHPPKTQMELYVEKVAELLKNKK